VLYANIYPAPSFPYNLFPYILLAWLVIGAAVIVFSPTLVRRVAAGLARDLGLPAGRVVGEVEPYPVEDLAADDLAADDLAGDD
jgi:hypothetical protein